MESSEKTAWLSILTNVLLVGIKTFVAFISGSLAVMADVIHSLSDVVSSTIILLGIKISECPARGFPYGLYKVANWLLKNGLDVLISRQSQAGKGPGFVLGNGGAEILLTREVDAEKALEMVENELGQYIEDIHFQEFNQEKTDSN